MTHTSLKLATFISDGCNSSHLLMRESEGKSIMVSSFLLRADAKQTR
jgi:hypothetical protein